MKKVLAIAVLVVGIAASAFTVPSFDPGPDKWFSADEIGVTGFGSIPSSATPAPGNFDDNLPLAAAPSIAVDPEVGECLQNTERICSAKFTTDTDVNSANSPVSYLTGQIVLGEYKY